MRRGLISGQAYIEHRGEVLGSAGEFPEMDISLLEGVDLSFLFGDRQVKLHKYGGQISYAVSAVEPLSDSDTL